MRSIGFLVIVIGILIFIISGLVEYGIANREEGKSYTDVQNEILLANWLENFSQILVLAGIGFILYDIAVKGGDKGVIDLLRKLKGGDSEIRTQI
ncbi:MAG: hypothetical protein JSV09_14645 [Thermoplasmata archaeon]|nr:MAG: hypothetical protein JSV09_14645 [Thermoplasmata archaeon]